MPKSSHGLCRTRWAEQPVLPLQLYVVISQSDAAAPKLFEDVCGLLSSELDYKVFLTPGRKKSMSCPKGNCLSSCENKEQHMQTRQNSNYLGVRERERNEPMRSCSLPLHVRCLRVRGTVGSVLLPINVHGFAL